MTLDNILVQCCDCKKVQIDKEWIYLPNTYATQQYRYSHSYCPPCYEKALRGIEDAEENKNS